MPLRGLSFVPSPELLSGAEIEAVVRAAVAVGFRKFRLTGGEPTLRPDLVEIVARIAAIDGVSDLAMTTNGILLPRLARPLRAAGLRRLNVHLDTLDPERLHKLMRFASLAEIEAGIAAAEDAGLVPIKINCTVTRDFNDADAVDLARRALDGDWHVRFIELMPLGGGEPEHAALSQFVPTAETKARIEAELGPLEPLLAEGPSDEARNYRFARGGGVVGFISPVSAPYCGSCNRMRLDGGRQAAPVPAERRRDRRQGSAARGRRRHRAAGDPREGRAREADGTPPGRGPLDPHPLDVPDRRLRQPGRGDALSRPLQPRRAVRVVLLLPDRHARLERVDREAAGGEGLARGAGDETATTTAGSPTSSVPSRWTMRIPVMGWSRRASAAISSISGSAISS